MYFLKIVQFLLLLIFNELLPLTAPFERRIKRAALLKSLPQIVLQTRHCTGHPCRCNSSPPGDCASLCRRSPSVQPPRSDSRGRQLRQRDLEVEKSMRIEIEFDFIIFCGFSLCIFLDFFFLICIGKFIINLLLLCMSLIISFSRLVSASLMLCCKSKFH